MALTGYKNGSTTYHDTQDYAVALQQEIARQNGGKTLELSTIYVWLHGEGQAPAMASDSNPLNIPCSSDMGSTYAGYRSGCTSGGNTIFKSIDAGITATAFFLLHGGGYSGVRSTMAPAGKGDPVAQATAIQNSPWASGHYGYHLASQVSAVLNAGPSWLKSANGSTTPISGGGGAGSTGTGIPVSDTSTPVDPALIAILNNAATKGDTWLMAATTDINADNAGQNTTRWQADVGAAIDALHLNMNSKVTPATVAQVVAYMTTHPNAGGTITLGPQVTIFQLPQQILDALAGGATNLHNFLAFVADAENWVLIGALGLGLYFAVRGYRNLGEA